MKLQFSRRLPADFTPNALHMALAGRPDVVDLMQSNPTQCGFIYPNLQVPLVGAEALAYSPDPFGLPLARQALATYLGGMGQRIDPRHLVLTSSTSEAYALLFKLLCNPGDRIAVGAPTYPLVAHLAELENVGTASYELVYEGRWCLDLDSVAAALCQGVKALVLIAPNNPTGACLRPDEARDLGRLCASHGVPLIVDEVFAPYHHVPDLPCAAALLENAPLTFVLRGLSKEVGLPQLKLGWIGVHGDPAWVDHTVPRLEWIADAYLSVSTPVQQALSTLLAHATPLQAQIRARLAANREFLAQALEQLPALTLLASDGGWYSVLQVPQHLGEDELVLRLAQDAGIVVHPGYYYDFARRGYLVCGLLISERLFERAWNSGCGVLQSLL